MGRDIPRLNVEIDDSLNEKLRRYIVLRWGLEKFYGKVALVVREALEEFLDKNLPLLEGETKSEATRENI